MLTILKLKLLPLNVHTETSRPIYLVFVVPMSGRCSSGAKSLANSCVFRSDADNSQAQTPAFECTYRNQQANLPRLCRTNVGTMLFWGKIARQFVCFPI